MLVTSFRSGYVALVAGARLAEAGEHVVRAVRAVHAPALPAEGACNTDFTGAAATCLRCVMR